MPVQRGRGSGAQRGHLGLGEAPGIALPGLGGDRCLRSLLPTTCFGKCAPCQVIPRTQGTGDAPGPGRMGFVYLIRAARKMRSKGDGGHYVDEELALEVVDGDATGWLTTSSLVLTRWCGS